MKQSYAVVAISKHGVDTARRLREGLPECDLFYPRKFARGDESACGIKVFDGSTVELMAGLFGSYQGIVGVFSVGVMVRLIAPLLRDKTTDPGVVVVDERGQHAVSVLSGHLGGANALTQRVAQVLGAQPVITTASDVGGTIAVDLLGKEFGFEIDNFDQVTTVSAAVVNEERVHIVQEAGESDWWRSERPLPANLHVFSEVVAAMAEPFAAALVITPRILAGLEAEQLLKRGVLYRPKVITVGVGCNRGTSAMEIETVILATLAELHLSAKSVRELATIDKKADEPGLLEVCQRYGWPLVTFSAEELNQVPNPQPSAVVHRYVGAWGVCAPAARLASGAAGWWLEKKKSGNVTVSVCLIGEVSGQLALMAATFREQTALIGGGGDGDE